MIGNPSNLELLLHCYYSPEPHPRRGAPAVEEGIQYLFNHGMVDRTDFPRATGKGAAFIRHLMTIPFPVQRWEVPLGASGQEGEA